MKIRLSVIVLLVLFCNPIFSQKNVRDSLKSFAINVVQKAIDRGKIKKLAVWDFTDMNKEVSSFGRYISEQFSVYAEDINSLQLMDRQNLKSLLREHKLKSEGFIDKNTIMQLGKFKEVDAVVVGSVILVDGEFQVVVKVIETSFGTTIAADEQFFETDKRMAAISGTSYSSDSDETSKVVANDVSAKNKKPKIETCIECNGSGLIKVQSSCDACRGTGNVTCSQCGGTGKYGSISPTRGNYETPRCSKCSGGGTTICTICSGTAQVTRTKTCLKCNGTGKNY